MKSLPDPHQVVKALESTLAFNPGNAEVMIRLAVLYGALGMPAQAAAISEKARHIAPHHTFFHKNTVRTPAAPLSDGFRGQVKAFIQRFLTWG